MQIRKKPRLQKIWIVSQESIYKKLSEFNVYDFLKTNPITTTGILTLIRCRFQTLMWYHQISLQIGKKQTVLRNTNSTGTKN